MSEPATIALTFKGLLVYHLWREYPSFSSQQIETRVLQLIIDPTCAMGREINAWSAAIRDRTRCGVEA